MNTRTKTVATHTTTIQLTEGRKDGGRSDLLELFDDVRGDKRVGKLTAQFGIGGSISHLTFEESEVIRQSDIEVEE